MERMKHTQESIIGRKGSSENPCYKYAHLFKGDINGFFSYLGFLRDTGDNTEYAAYDAFFYGTGVKYNLRAVLLYDLESWIYTYLDELEQEAIDMDIPRHNARSVAIERLVGDIEDDDEFFERCNILKKYIKNKSARYNLLRNFRIYLHLS